MIRFAFQGFIRMLPTLSAVETAEATMIKSASFHKRLYGHLLLELAGRKSPSYESSCFDEWAVHAQRCKGVVPASPAASCRGARTHCSRGGGAALDYSRGGATDRGEPQASR